MSGRSKSMIQKRTNRIGISCAIAALIAALAFSRHEIAGAADEPKTQLPYKVLWAWQRSEDLSSINPQEFGVAFLACHTQLTGDKVSWQWRNQPLKVPPNTKVVPVIRIDVDHKRPVSFSQSQLERLVDIVVKASRASNSAQVQIDFDALASERSFYRRLIEAVHSKLQVPLSITALASWCLFDNWIKDLPVTESVPMMFSLGRDRKKVLLHFRTNGDFFDLRSRQSLGLSLEDSEVNGLMIPLSKRRKIPVRVYVFTRTAWTPTKIQFVRSLLE